MQITTTDLLAIQNKEFESSNILYIYFVGLLNADNNDKSSRETHSSPSNIQDLLILFLSSYESLQNYQNM